MSSPAQQKALDGFMTQFQEFIQDVAGTYRWPNPFSVPRSILEFKDGKLSRSENYKEVIYRKPENSIQVCLRSLEKHEVILREAEDIEELDSLIPGYINAGAEVLKRIFLDEAKLTLRNWQIVLTRLIYAQSGPPVTQDRVNLQLKRLRQAFQSPAIPTSPSIVERQRRGAPRNPHVAAFEKFILECKNDGVKSLDDIAHRADKRKDLLLYLNRMKIGGKEKSFMKLVELPLHRRNFVRKLRHVWPEFKDKPKSLS